MHNIFSIITFFCIYWFLIIPVEGRDILGFFRSLFHHSRSHHNSIIQQLNHTEIIETFKLENGILNDKVEFFRIIIGKYKSQLNELRKRNEDEEVKNKRLIEEIKQQQTIQMQQITKDITEKLIKEHAIEIESLNERRKKEKEIEFIELRGNNERIIANMQKQIESLQQERKDMEQLNKKQQQQIQELNSAKEKLKSTEVKNEKIISNLMNKVENLNETIEEQDKIILSKEKHEKKNPTSISSNSNGNISKTIRPSRRNTSRK